MNRIYADESTHSYTSYHIRSYIADSSTALDSLAVSATCGQSMENALTENDLRLE